MKILDRILIVLCLLSLVCVFATGCSKNETSEQNGMNEEEINNLYNEIVAAESDGLLPEDYNPITDNFTVVDFQFTMTDDTVAFNMPDNSYCDIVPTVARLGFTDGRSADSFEGTFKNAKGLSFDSTVAAHVAAYKAEQGAVKVTAEGEKLAYDAANEFSKVVFGFVSDDGENFSLISSDNILKILDARSNIPVGGAYSEDIYASILGTHDTVCVIDLVQDANGILSQYIIYRFDKASDEPFNDHMH